MVGLFVCLFSVEALRGDSSPGEEYLVGHVHFFAPCAHKEPVTGAQAKQRYVKKLGKPLLQPQSLLVFSHGEVQVSGEGKVLVLAG